MFAFSAANDFGIVLPEGSDFSRSLSHRVDLNVSVTLGVHRNSSGHAFVHINASVPYIDEASPLFCASTYLVDIGNSLGDAKNLTFFAHIDALGKARNSCAALNYSYNVSTFIENASARYRSVANGWNVSVRAGRAKYTTDVPIPMRTILSSCGGRFTVVDDVRRYAFDVVVCHAGYYGPRCSGNDGSYAIACRTFAGVVLESPQQISAATSIGVAASNFIGEISFTTFNVSECVLEAARGMVYFDVIVSDFDTLSSVTLTNPLKGNSGVASISENLPLDLNQGVYVFGGKPFMGRVGTVLWTIVLVSPLIHYVEENAFAKYFSNVYSPNKLAAQFMFAADFENGNTLRFVSVVVESELVASAASRGSCEIPQPLSRPPPPPLPSGPPSPPPLPKKPPPPPPLPEKPPPPRRREEGGSWVPVFTAFSLFTTCSLTMLPALFIST